jgi:uncharacterized membrane protein HdeD (DUF308 family)
MNETSKFHWGRAALGGLLAEASVFAIVFPVLYLFGQQAFLGSILVASAVMPFVFALWVCKRVKSHFVLHGAMVGIVAALVYLIVAHGLAEPLLYKIAHGLKIIGGAAGGALASRQNASRAGRSDPTTL